MGDAKLGGKFGELALRSPGDVRRLASPLQRRLAVSESEMRSGEAGENEGLPLKAFLDGQCPLERRQCVSICSGVQRRVSETPVGVRDKGWRLESLRSLHGLPGMCEHCAGIAEHR